MHSYDSSEIQTILALKNILSISKIHNNMTFLVSVELVYNKHYEILIELKNMFSFCKRYKRIQ